MLIGTASCLAAVAYGAGATSTPAGDGHGAIGPRPPRPRILTHPAKPSLSTIVAFTFTTRSAVAGFQCQLDGGAWRSCGPRVVYRGLRAGSHSFRVRSEAGNGVRSRSARFDWVRAEPKGFAIEPVAPGLNALYPGAPASTLSLQLSNPNPAPILITALRASIAAAPPGCDGNNFELTPSNASRKKPLRVPARGSVTVPTTVTSAPAIALRDLPVSQDACKGAQLRLAFSGEAHG
ncbi:MAG: hypothetical protein ABW065_01555 [Solirubrobacterales bacterium]